MKTFTRTQLRGGTRAGAPVLVGTALLAAACASGGGRAALTPAEAEALFAELSGVWLLDESGSSPPPIPADAAGGAGTGTITIIKGSDGSGRIIGDMPVETGVPPTVRRAALEVLQRRPGILALNVDAEALTYRPSPGRSIEVPMNGPSVFERVEGQDVRIRIVWDDGRMGIEYALAARPLVREVLEVVDGRLKMTRRLRLVRDVDRPLVLWYDRAGGP